MTLLLRRSRAFLSEAWQRFFSRTPKWFRSLQKLCLALITLNVTLQGVMQMGYAPATHKQLMGNWLLICIAVLAGAQFACDGELKLPTAAGLLAAGAAPAEADLLAGDPLATDPDSSLSSFTDYGTL